MITQIRVTHRCDYCRTSGEVRFVAAPPLATLVRLPKNWIQQELAILCPDCAWRQAHGLPYGVSANVRTARRTIPGEA